jgi:hypothetical protein
MKGLALLKTEDSAQALSQFQHLLAESAANSGVREYAQYFVRAEHQSLTDDPETWLFTDLSIGYNTNVFGDGNPATYVERPVGNWLLGGGWRPYKKGFFSLRVGNNLSGEEIVALPSSRFIREIFWFQFRYQNPWWLVQLSPQGELSWLGGDSYLWRPTFLASIQRVLGDERVGFTSMVARNVPGSVGFDYLDGNSWSLRAFWLHQGSNWLAGPYFGANRESSGALPLVGASLPLAYTGYGPGYSGFWSVSRRWEISGSISYSWRKFDGVTEPAGETRNDDVFNIYARFSRRMRPDLSVYFSLDGTVNHSTIGSQGPENKDYSQFVVLTGVSWDLL